MKPYKVNELRKMFLDFFDNKEHLVMKSFSLVPNNDNSLLLISDGMAPFKPYFTGQEIPPKKRIATCQKCIRTTDIEYVGKTAKQDLEKETMSARILQRIKNAAGTDLYVNVTAELLQSVEGKMLKQCCGRKLHPLNELWNPEAEEKAEDAVLLLIVQKGITTSEEINNAMEDGQLFGLDLVGCVMIA